MYSADVGAKIIFQVYFKCCPVPSCDSLLVTHHVQECQTKTPGAVLSRNASRLLFEVPSVELIVRRQREQFTASLLTS